MNNDKKMNTNKLNIILVTQDDPFYLPTFFEQFTKVHNDTDINVLGVVIQAPLGKKSITKLAKQMYEFYGLINFFIIGCKYVIYKLLNAVAIKVFDGKFPGKYSVRHVLKKNGWDILKYKNVNGKYFLKYANDNNVDLIVSVGGSQKFKTKVLNTPKYGCINIHNSKLPKNRGVLPTFWAMMDYENDDSTAMSVFKMDEDWDSGLIIKQKEKCLDMLKKTRLKKYTTKSTKLTNKITTH